TGYRRPTPQRPGMMPPKAFTYEAHVDGYRCPQGQLLAYARTDRTGYRHYKSNPVICRTCPLLASCTSSANATRLITRHVWADTRERTDAHRLTPLARPRPGMMPPKAFTYEAHVDGYRCPQGQLLAYARTDRTGYRHYK